MKKLTYKEAYDKITEAYIKGEIQPLDSTFCFCGTLCDNSSKWNNGRNIKELPYTLKQFKNMEWALINGRNKYGISNAVDCDGEDAIFVGMCAALEVLKQIHKERGEDVDGVQEFTKRKLDKIISD